MRAQKWILKKAIDGVPQISDFQIVEETVNPVLQNGEILCKAEYLSVDPYIRAGGLEGKPLEVQEGDAHIPGSQIARVLKSRHPDFPEGCAVYGFFGWRDLTIYKPGKERSWKSIYKLPDMRGLPPSYALGAIGMPGITAFFGVEKILEIKQGGTLVVSTATGAVGNMVLQIGKLKGCKTLVFTSTDAKVIWLKTLGAGYIFNYNKVDPQQVFSEFASEGIDFYFDNVGGEFTYHVMRNMKNHGRIAVCDAISCYGEADDMKTVPFDYLAIVDKKIRLEGFSVYEYEQEWEDGLKQMTNWIVEGKITVEESVLDGFKLMPQAFIDRYEGKVVGMQVIKA